MSDIQWLANVALCRYDSHHGMELGSPVGMKLEDGTSIPMSAIIRETLKEGEQVFVTMARGKQSNTHNSHKGKQYLNKRVMQCNTSKRCTHIVKAKVLT